MRRMLIMVAAVALAALSVAAVASADRGHRGDRNHDGLPDRGERRHHLSLKVNQAHRDPDRDKLDNRNEFRHGTDPNKRDTDDDGVRDRDEVNPVGTIASFDNGVLTITLRNGQSVSGRVTADTKIECENEDEVSAMAARDGGNSGPARPAAVARRRTRSRSRTRTSSSTAARRRRPRRRATAAPARPTAAPATRTKTRTAPARRTISSRA